MATSAAEPRDAHLVVVEAGVLRRCCELIQPACSALPHPVAVGEDITQTETTMPAGLGEGDLPILEELHERRPRHAEQIGGLLGREGRILRDDRDGLAAGKQFRDVSDHVGDDAGETDPGPVLEGDLGAGGRPQCREDVVEGSSILLRQDDSDEDAHVCLRSGFDSITPNRKNRKP